MWLRRSPSVAVTTPDPVAGRRHEPDRQLFNVAALGVEHFGHTGPLADLYQHYGIDANSIVAAAQAVAPGRPIRHLKALPGKRHGPIV